MSPCYPRRKDEVFGRDSKTPAQAAGLLRSLLDAQAIANLQRCNHFTDYLGSAKNLQKGFFDRGVNFREIFPLFSHHVLQLVRAA
jgi:hypothetical protein